MTRLFPSPVISSQGLSEPDECLEWSWDEGGSAAAFVQLQGHSALTKSPPAHGGEVQQKGTPTLIHEYDTCLLLFLRGLKWHFLSVLWARKAVSIPGGIQKPCSCGAWGHGLVVDLAALGSWLDSDLRGLFQPEWFCVSDQCWVEQQKETDHLLPFLIPMQRETPPFAS